MVSSTWKTPHEPGTDPVVTVAPESTQPATAVDLTNVVPSQPCHRSIPSMFIGTDADPENLSACRSSDNGPGKPIDVKNSVPARPVGVAPAVITSAPNTLVPKTAKLGTIVPVGTVLTWLPIKTVAAPGAALGVMRRGILAVDDT